MTSKGQDGDDDDDNEDTDDDISPMPRARVSFSEKQDVRNIASVVWHPSSIIK